MREKTQWQIAKVAIIAMGYGGWMASIEVIVPIPIATWSKIAILICTGIAITAMAVVAEMRVRAYLQSRVQQTCEGVRFWTGHVWTNDYDWAYCDIGIARVERVTVEVITDPHLRAWAGNKYVYQVYEFTRYSQLFKMPIVIVIPMPFDEAFEFNEGHVLQGGFAVCAHVEPIHLRRICDRVFGVVGSGMQFRAMREEIEHSLVTKEEE